MGKSITERLREHSEAMSKLRKELAVKIDEFNEKHKAEWIEAEASMVKWWNYCTAPETIHTEVSLENVVCFDPHIDVDGERKRIVHVGTDNAFQGLYNLYTNEGRFWACETPAKAEEEET